MNKLQINEHPEISMSLFELGMILDIGIEKQKAKIAKALPTFEIPVQVQRIIEDRISKEIEKKTCIRNSIILKWRRM
ncbi:MAG: hypothetical protein GF313_08240 [Caldithrix sp.]|nr:hypothetical protein [Caldithrix sp.]